MKRILWTVGAMVLSLAPAIAGEPARHARDEAAIRGEIQSHVAAENVEPLKQLEWMIGTWVDRSKDSTVETVCRWAKNKSFLLRTFKVSARGADDLEGTQVVGWDPVRQRIRSWVFDSDGGYSEGVWSHRANAWIVKSSGFLADGRPVAAVHVITCVDPDTFTWKSFGRKVGDAFLPNIEAVTIHRQQPTAQNKAQGK